MNFNMIHIAWPTLGGQYVNNFEIRADCYVDYNINFIICLLHYIVKYNSFIYFCSKLLVFKL